MNISVLIPATGKCEYLLEAIESALCQSYPCEFEVLIVVQDIPTEKITIIQKIPEPNLRIIFDKGSGIVSALNLGVSRAKYEWIARLDSDDKMTPHRIQNQIEHISRNSNCVVVGGQVILIDLNGSILRNARYPINHFSISYGLNVESTIPHPGSLIRKSALLAVGGYRSKYQYVEDFDLWRRLSRVGSLHNIRKPVVFYRKHPTQTTNLKVLEIGRFNANMILQNISGHSDIDPKILEEFSKIVNYLHLRRYLSFFSSISSFNKKIIILYLRKKIALYFFKKIGI